MLCRGVATSFQFGGALRHVVLQIALVGFEPVDELRILDRYRRLGGKLLRATTVAQR